MREIVTIQVGDFANFIGSHFWNFQDELLGLAEDSQADVVFRNQCLNMDLLYRTGETQQGILTYTPRLVSIGFQGSLGSMSSHGTLYNENEKQPAPFDVVTWSGNLSSQVSEPQKKNLFLQSLYKEEEKFHMMNGNTSVRHDIHSDISDKDIVECLENEVQYWTDFSKVHYHPRSLYELSGLWVDVQQFNNYGIGRDAFSDSLRGEEMNESLRFFIEECDHIQGIQFVVDDSGGFSGVAAEFLENIADEYTNTPVLLYAVRDPGQINPSSQKKTVFQNLHDAISFSRLSSFCKLIVPVGLPSLCESKVGRFLCIDNGKPYHTSAVYASAMHSISLPFRMEPLGPTDESLYVSGAVDMNGAIQMLAGQARQNIVTILDVAMPAPPLTGTQAEQSVLENLHPLTPETSEDVEDLQAVESLTIHGAHGSGSHRASVFEVKEAVQAAYEHVVTRPRFSHLSVASCPLPIPLPFPSIFANLVGKHGELLGSPISSCTSRGSVNVHSIPMSARLRSSTAILPFLEHRLRNLQRFGIQRGALGNELLRRWGFGKDEVEDIGEALSKMVTTLDPHSEECSDSD